MSSFLGILISAFVSFIVVSILIFNDLIPASVSFGAILIEIIVLSFLVSTLVVTEISLISSNALSKSAFLSLVLSAVILIIFVNSSLVKVCVMTLSFLVNVFLSNPVKNSVYFLVIS